MTGKERDKYKIVGISWGDQTDLTFGLCLVVVHDTDNNWYEELDKNFPRQWGTSPGEFDEIVNKKRLVTLLPTPLALELNKPLGLYVRNELLDVLGIPYNNPGNGQPAWQSLGEGGQVLIQEESEIALLRNRWTEILFGKVRTALKHYLQNSATADTYELEGLLEMARHIADHGEPAYEAYLMQEIFWSIKDENWEIENFRTHFLQSGMPDLTPEKIQADMKRLNGELAA